MIDGKIVVKSPGTWAEKAAQTAVESTGRKWEALSEEERHLMTSKRAGVEVQVTKAAVEPVVSCGISFIEITILGTFEGLFLISSAFPVELTWCSGSLW